MPTYTLKDTDTGDVFDILLSIADKEQLLSENPQLTQVPTAPSIVASVGDRTGKTDEGWKENLARIAEAHPNSALANKYGSKDHKSAKTRSIVEKWRSRLGKS